MVSSRTLVVNADDFGQTHGINRGVARAFEAGIVTSASLMTRWPAAVEATTYARQHPALSVGLHLDFGEWTYGDGQWRPLYHVADTSDEEAVRAEVQGQLERFRSLMKKDPTHLDSHQHVHRTRPLRDVVRALGTELGVPVRGFDPRISYRGDFYGMSGKGEPYPEGITEAALLRLITDLPAGATELGCHPGEDDGTELVYRNERPLELEALCAPAVATAITNADVDLVSFAAFRRQRDDSEAPRT